MANLLKTETRKNTMADALSARQQIVDKIKDSSNILVTVSTNPSVDELSAALGLTLMLNKLGKHATSVVSGDIPPAITFLDPEKTFENTVDSLRDFIIALDKEKADHLRYKVEGDVVKIFITPYRTTITDKDLDFSQGDYNVELVLALNVTDGDHLDKALEAHGRILHDATVATISTGGVNSNLGSIDWRDDGASSLSEMLVSLSEAIKGDKTVLDEQTSTALLTGIVAATDRFSNDHTSSKVMTMAAQLMAAGANQQLIAAKLEDANAITTEDKDKTDNQNSDGTTNLSEGESTKVADKAPKKAKPAEEKAEDGALAISHEKEGDLEEVTKETAAENTDDAARAAEEKLAAELQTNVPGSIEPSLGGTLNATTEQAADDRRREEDDDRNKTILSHEETGKVDSSPTIPPAFNAASQGDSDEPPTVDPFAADPVQSSPEPSLPPVVTPSNDVPAKPPVSETLADIDAKLRQPHEEDARAAVEAALGGSSPASMESSTPAPSLSEVPGLPPLPDFSTLPPPPPVPTTAAPDIASTQPPVGAVPPEKLADIFAPEETPPAKPNDPGEFKIPGQS